MQAHWCSGLPEELGGVDELEASGLELLDDHLLVDSVCSRIDAVLVGSGVDDTEDTARFEGAEGGVQDQIRLHSVLVGDRRDEHVVNVSDADESVDAVVGNAFEGELAALVHGGNESIASTVNGRDMARGTGRTDSRAVGLVDMTTVVGAGL